MIQFLDPISTILFPVGCRGCGTIIESPSLGFACQECWGRTTYFDASQTTCVKCGALLGEMATERAIQCGNCREHHYDLARAVGAYDGGLAISVINLKRVPHLCRQARTLLLGLAENLDVGSSAIVIPVPLSKQRLIERGFNQAGIIGKALADYLRLRLDEHSLIRHEHTVIHRAGMDKKARESTVANAFRVVRPNFIADREALLVDDVMTSGSTVSQCAFALKKSGASKVTVLTFARADFR